jgi:hypothetical protein
LLCVTKSSCQSKQKKVQYLLCVTSDSDFEKLFTFYCLLSVKRFFSLPQISRISPVWRPWLLHVMSSAEGQFVSSIRADTLFSLYSIRKSGTSLCIPHQTRFIFFPPRWLHIFCNTSIEMLISDFFCVSVIC